MSDTVLGTGHTTAMVPSFMGKKKFLEKYTSSYLLFQGAEINDRESAKMRARARRTERND